MSWFYATSRTAHPSPNENSPPYEEPLRTISFSRFSIAVGGNPDTSFLDHNPDTNSGWAVVGVGLSQSDSGGSILSGSDWKRLLTRESFDPTALDGHFAVVRWNGDRVECFTDQLGLRTIYFSATEQGLVICTRIDWLCHAAGHREPDFKALGSRWMMFHQLSYESCVHGIERLGPGGHTLFRLGSVIRATSTPWVPTFEPDSSDHAVELLKGYLASASAYRNAPSLGLSGGLDSRLLLSLATSMSLDRLGIHTFGPDDDPDVQLAGRMTSALGIPFLHLNDPLPDADTCLKGIFSFVSQTLLVEPVSSYTKLRYYGKLRASGHMLIDGGFGEIARRQYMNRVVKLGQSALRKRDSSRLYQLMRSPRADIFSAEATHQLEAGARSSLNKALDEMPAVEKIGVENFVDLLAVRTRVPNYGGPEQGRLDSEILNFMPLVQPSFLRAIFGVNPKVRSNAGLYCDIIRKANPLLAQFPLAKGGHTHRFGLSTNLTWLSVRVKSKIARGFSDPMPNLLLEHIKDFVTDIAHSHDVLSDPMYDQKKVVESVDKYYAGDHSLRGVVDWWLTFELWKRSLQPCKS